MGAADGELWDRVREGDPDAFVVLFRRHSQAIYNFCFRRTADWALAEDLTSAVFLEAWHRREEVRIHQGRVLPWLYGVATNVVRNSRRGLRRREAALARLTPAEMPDFAEELAERLDAVRRMRRILGLVERLPRRHQDALALCDWQGLTYEEAAVALGVPVGTVRSRLSRARARLRELAASDGRGGVDRPDEGRKSMEAVERDG